MRRTKVQRRLQYCQSCRYGAHLADASPDGKLVAYAAYNRVVLVDCTTQAVVALLAGHSNR